MTSASSNAASPATAAGGALLTVDAPATWPEVYPIRKGTPDAPPC